MINRRLFDWLPGVISIERPTHMFHGYYNLMSSEWYKRSILLAKLIACSFNFHWISWYNNEQVVLWAGNVLQNFLERKYAWKRKTVTCDDWNRDMMMFHLCNGDIIPNNIFMYRHTHTVLQSSILFCLCLSQNFLQTRHFRLMNSATYHKPTLFSSLFFLREKLHQ